MKLKFLALFVFLFSITSFAQTPATILKQAEKALGGTKALRSMRTSLRSGTITRVKDGAAGKFTMQASQPNLFNITFDINGFEAESGYNGRSGWQRDSRGGLQTMTGNASLALQAEAVYRNSLWLNYKKERSKIAAGGKSEIEGKSTNVVTLTTSKGIIIKMFFDAVTGLPAADEIASGLDIKRFTYNDFRSVSGVMQPYKIKMLSGDESYEIQLDNVQINPQIAKSEFDFPQISDQPLPDVPTLLKQLQANEDEVEKILDTYSYVQRSTSRELGKDGVLRETGSETFQMSFYKGRRIRRLIEKDGKPLDAREQEKADKEAGKQVEEIEKDIAKAEKDALKPGSDNRPRVSVAELLRASILTNPRRERFRGRDVIVFDFEPNPSFDYKNAQSILKFFGKTAGVMWIDEQDKQVARLEAYLADSFNIGGGVVAKLKKGASFTLEQERLNDEIWLPAMTDIDLSVRVLLVKGVNINQVIRSYDYRKFTTEVKDAKVDDLPEQ